MLYLTNHYIMNVLKSLGMGFLFLILNSSLSIAQDPKKIATVISENAKQVYVMDFTTDTVLFEKNAQELLHPSSMTKIMELYVAFKYLKNGQIQKDQLVPVSEKAWRTEGSRTFLPLNTPVSIDDLLKGVIVQSGNDASVALAEAIGGTEENFAVEMTKIARELGAKNSTFFNATGLAQAGHLSTAEDLARISMRLIKDFPDYYPLFSEKKFTFNKITQPNRNLLLSYNGLGCDGIKTGHTDEGGYGIVASALQRNRRILVVINGTSSEKERAKIAYDLLNWGFSRFAVYTIDPKDHTFGQKKVHLGVENKIPVGILAPLKITLPRGDIRKIKVETSVFSDLQAPLKKGQVVGKILIHPNSQDPSYAVIERPLYALKDIQEAGFFRKIWLKIIHWKW